MTTSNDINRMKYSRNYLNKIGQTISSGEGDVFKIAEAVTVVDDWRRLHLKVLEYLSKEISIVLEAEGIVPAFSSSRLKRMESIIGKLKRSPKMGLGGMQDIGGARFVFDNIVSLEKAANAIEKAQLNNFEQDRATYDYIAEPKSSGYRSIHIVYKHKSSDSDLDGMRVELQIRTKLQHDWATAVETAELLSRTPLKAGLGDEDWLEFFRLASAVFARKEGKPTNGQFNNWTEADFCRQFARLDNGHRFTGLLQAFAGAVKTTETEAFSGGQVIVFIDIESRKSGFKHFEDNESDKASNLYTQLESSIDHTREAVVMVQVKDIRELREAYPSYFLNAAEFLESLSDFTNECRIKGYIE